MRHLDLFSGIGGFALAAQWAGYETVQFVEIEPFPCKVLQKHWPDVPIHGDIKTFNGNKYAGKIELLTAGFPCQPYSLAGLRLGKKDDRALWPEVIRIIKEVRPTWFIGENVAGILSMGIKNYIIDLEDEGYEVQCFVIPACAVGAPHRRDRVWIVSHAVSVGQQQRSTTESGQKSGETLACNRNITVADSTQRNDRRYIRGAESGQVPKFGECSEPQVIANRASERLQITRFAGKQKSETKNRKRVDCGFKQHGFDASDSGSTGRQECDVTTKPDGKGHCAGDFDEAFIADSLSINANNGGFRAGRISQLQKAKIRWKENWVDVATRLCRVDDGLPRRMDRGKRLKALGNAIVPQVAYEIIKAIREAE